MQHLYLKTLKLSHFKNYTNENFELDPKINGFLGDNGMGKTNALDAIHYLCVGKSKFKLPDRFVKQKEAAFFRIEGLFQQDEQPIEITAKVIPSQLKELSCNQVPYQRLSDHIGILPVVFIAPDDTQIIHEGSEERRRLIDHALCQEDPKYTKHLILYTKLLKQRNALLKQSHLGAPHFSQSLLDVYSQQMLAPANYLFEKRKTFVQELKPYIQKYYETISNAREEISVTYSSPLLESTFEQILQAQMSKDIALQRTTLGPHRDDLQIKLNELPAKKFASQGQLKSILFAIKLAEYDFLHQAKQKKPILILDDIFDKLDPKRVHQLLEHLLTKDYGQIFLSDTNVKTLPELVKNWIKAGKFYEIQNGSANLL